MIETERNQGDFEMPAVRPAVPETVPSEGYRPEIGGPVLDRLREEDDRRRLPPDTPDIDEVIERKRRSTTGRSFGEDPVAYLASLQEDLSEAKRKIELTAALIGSFGEQPVWYRVLHRAEYRRLQNEYDTAIREEHGVEELLRMAKAAD